MSDKQPLDPRWSRRDFVKKSTLAAAALATGPAWAALAGDGRAAVSAGSATQFRGVYLEAPFLRRSPQNWDIGGVLDFIREEMRCDQVFLRVYAYNRPENFYFRPDPAYYRDTALKMDPGAQSEAPSQALPFDVLDRVCEEAGRRDMRTHVILFPSKERPRTIVNAEQVLLRDDRGAVGRTVCFNHPDYKAHFFGMVRNLFERYPIAGAKFGSERGGPLFMMQKQYWRPHCFCDHCLRSGRERGIDPERAREGYRKLWEQWEIPGGRGGSRRINASMAEGSFPRAERPVDGFLVGFMRLMFRYPEILAWDRMWFEHQMELQRGMNRIAKSIRPDALTGAHLWHRGRSFSPLMRAAEDVRELAEFSDYVRPTVFTQPSGSRFIEESMTLCQTFFGDLGLEEMTDILYDMCGYKNEGSVDEIFGQPFSTAYVRREVEMVKARLEGTAKVFAGISASYYGGPEAWSATLTGPERIAEEIEAAAEAGTDGFLFGSVAMDDRPRMRGIGEGLRRIGWA